MDNSADNKPLGGNNWWALVEQKVESVEAEEKLMIAEKKRDLTLAIFTRSSTSAERRDWDLCMPIPYSLCKEIISDSKYLDKKALKVKHFASYSMNDSEEQLFGIIADFGKALAVETIVDVIRRQAIDDACTRSQKLYLEYITGMGAEDEEDSEGINLHIHLSDNEEPKEKEIGGEVINIRGDDAVDNDVDNDE